jgi:hypothetical protein
MAGLSAVTRRNRRERLISGKPAETETYHWQALKPAPAIGSTRDEARALAGLGRYAAAVSHIMRAKAPLRQARVIFPVDRHG